MIILEEMNVNDKMKVVVIYGSVRSHRYCDTIMKWVVGELRRHDPFAFRLLDPAEYEGNGQARDRAAQPGVAQHLDWADAFIVVTPEYNHGYPAALKALIDSVNEPWQAKPVAFVSYGGVSGGLRAVEQLRLVFAELHAVGIRECVSFANPWDSFSVDGTLPAGAGKTSSQAMARLLSSLLWWARALRAARLATPYGQPLA